jgi:transcriptional regulator with XRE-family HTH domain
MTDISKRIGQNIRTLRRRLNLSQEEAGELAGVTGAYWGQLERGERNPTLSTLSQIASALESSLDLLVQPKDLQESDINYNELLQMLNLCDETDLKFFHNIIISYLKIKGKLK